MSFSGALGRAAPVLLAALSFPAPTAAQPSALAALAAIAAPASPAPPAASEYEVKAEFLHRFAQFVTWPPEAFAPAEGAPPAADDAPLTIGVLGSDPFGAVLDAAVAEARVGGRRFAVRRFKTLAELQPCHILFVAASEEPRLPAVLERLRETPTLTVGESRRFARRGGVIGFVLVENRLRFEISATAAERARLKVSSQLLRLAAAVR